VHQRPLKPGVTVEGEVDHHLLAPQAHAEGLGKLTVVLDHEHSHAIASSVPGRRQCRSSASGLRIS
jgi:hypothetical protein